MQRLLILIALFYGSLTAGAQTISLAGQWYYKLDPLNAGVQQQWFNTRFNKSIQLPGTLDDAGIGKPAALTADTLNKEVLIMLTRKHAYVGAAWYSKDIIIPANWKNKEVELLLERVIWNTRVWIDGHEAGTQESLSTPHRFSVSSLLSPGKHLLAIRVDNSKQYDITHLDMAHAYTNGTQIIWNGVIGQLKLVAKDKIHLDQVQVYPDVRNQSAKIIISLQNKLYQQQHGRLQVQVIGKNNTVAAVQQLPVIIPAGASTKEVQLSLRKQALLWDEFNSNLYTLRVQLTVAKPAMQDVVTARFGMRHITHVNSRLQINGRRLFLRGTLECNIFPLTGHPPMNKQGWLKVFNTAKAYGLNHLRFHSWCPPQAAFDVADSLGFYLQIELPFWSLKAGQDTAANRFITEEALRISREYGNHPSFCLWSMGNELQGNLDFLHQLVQQLKAVDTRHLYTSTTFTFQKDHGRWPEPGDDFYITQYTKKGWVRGQGIFNTYAPDFKTDYTKAIDSLPVPVITHEIGQYSVYPNLDEIKKYTGVLDPLNFKAIQKDLQRKGLLSLAAQFTLASGKFSANLYKEEIERALKTKGLSGFQLLDLHDFPGQGTALIGILDAFWDSKGLVTPAAHRMYCAAVVPLVRFQKAVYTNDETFTAVAEIANFSKGPLEQVTPVWMVRDPSGKLIASGRLKTQTVETGNGHELGSFSLDLKNIQHATALTIQLQIKGTAFQNTWQIWVYPQQLPATTNDVIFTSSFTDALQYLEQGKNVLLNPDTAFIKGVEGRFAPVFWSPVHFPNQPGTMGILCNPQHPALINFPTSFYSDWQWWDLITASKTMVLDSLPAINPLVRVIDNFCKNRKMANIIEAKVGKGQLLLVSADLSHNLEKRPAARQLRYSLEQYMGTEAFNPLVTLSKEQLGYLVKAER